MRVSELVQLEHLVDRDCIMDSTLPQASELWLRTSDEDDSIIFVSNPVFVTDFHFTHKNTSFMIYIMD